MSFTKTPGGTRGARGPVGANALTRFAGRVMMSQHKRAGCQGTSGLPCGRTADLPAGGQVMSLLAVG